MVSSVAPQRFSITELGVAGAQCFAVSAGKASPQKRLNRNRGYLPGLRRPSRRMKTAVEGTDNHMVKRESFIKSLGLKRSFWVGQHTHAPRSQATNMSCADKSNPRSIICETR